MGLDINALVKGIYDRLNHSTVNALVNGVYHAKAKQGISHPYITFFIVSDVSDDTFTNWQDNCLAQIDIWSDKEWPKESGDIVTVVAARMDEATILATGYSVYFCQRQAVRLLYEPEPKIWHQLMEYRIIMGKPK